MLLVIFQGGPETPAPPPPLWIRVWLFPLFPRCCGMSTFPRCPPPPPPTTIPRSAHTCTILQFIVYFYHFLLRLNGREFDYWHTNRVGSAILSAAHTFYVTPTSQRAFALAFMSPFSTVSIFYVTPADETTRQIKRSGRPAKETVRQNS